MEELDELAEEVYERLRKRATKEQMGELIHMLLASKNKTPHLHDVAVRMAQIFTAREGH